MATVGVETPRERTERMLAEAEASRASLEASTELRCVDCGRVVLKFDPPIGRVTLPCRRCSGWTDFSTERAAGS